MATILGLQGEVTGERTLHGVIEMKDVVDYENGESAHFFEGAFNDGLVCGLMHVEGDRATQIQIMHLVNDGQDAPATYLLDKSKKGGYYGVSFDDKRGKNRNVKIDMLKQLTDEQIKEMKVAEYLQTARAKQPREKMTGEILNTVLRYENAQAEIKGYAEGLKENKKRTPNYQTAEGKVKGAKSTAPIDNN